MDNLKDYKNLKGQYIRMASHLRIALFILMISEVRCMMRYAPEEVSCGDGLDAHCECRLFPELSVFCSESNMSDVVVFPPEIAGQTNIHSLDLSHNKLRVLHTNIFHDLRIKHLDLSYNEFGLYVDPYLRSALGLVQRITLEGLDLSHNHLANIPEIVSYLPNLRMLDLTGNGFSRPLNQKIMMPGNLKELYLPSLEHFPFELSSQLKILKLTPRPVGSLNEMMNEIINNLSDLEVLSLSSGNYHLDLESLLQDLPELQHLEITDCDLGVEELDIILNHYEIPKLQTLSLVHVGLEHIPENLLRALPKLKILDLSENNILNVNAQAFERNRKIQFINLRHNSIFQIEGGAFDLPQLLEINLSHNKLTTISEDYFPVHLSEGMFLQAGENPLVCDCDNWWFMGLVSAQYYRQTGPLDQYEISNTLMCYEILSQEMMLVYEAYTKMQEGHVTC